ncbi:hypothetical protein ACJX0J_012109, partial [Zea mays]
MLEKYYKMLYLRKIEIRDNFDPIALALALVFLLILKNLFLNLPFLSFSLWGKDLVKGFLLLKKTGISITGMGFRAQTCMALWACFLPCYLNWHAWQYEDHSTHALCKYGPRVVVRCIKPINKGDEVCITYIDLLQTREARHSDLWSKYKFICSCRRCIASPEPYTDLILN